MYFYAFVRKLGGQGLARVWVCMPTDLVPAPCTLYVLDIYLNAPFLELDGGRAV